MTASSNGTVTGPRSSRVDLSVPANLHMANDNTVALPPSPPASPPASPPLPPRSPLRPRANARPADARSSISLDSIAEMTLIHSRSLGTLSGLLDSRSRIRSKTPEKPLPMPPPSPQADSAEAEGEDDSNVLIMPLRDGPPPLPSPGAAPVSKRTHALLELLSSERAYASDLALIRDIHIPLALGQPAPFNAAPATPTSSGSSTRTMSTASDSSSGSQHAAPMTQEDTRIIFNNVAEIAVFADMFTERLEDALGAVLEGGTGEDHVGALFLEMIPTLEPLYSTYITRHPAALEHLNALPQTEALKEYLSHTQTLAQSLTHAWDLPSLLIKPVQRLMKYSLLLGAIIDETPAAHPDKEALKSARARMEAVTAGVNEGRRRREVVKEVLTGIPKKGAEVKAKKKGLNIGVAASVNLGRVKSIRAAAFKVKEGAEANQEAEQVARWGEDLKSSELFVRHFAKAAKAWARSTTALTEQLKAWTKSFGQVIGVSADQSSEAFEAFMAVIDHGLLPICHQLERIVEDQLLRELSLLTDAASDPERLLEAMRTLEPLHYGLLNINVSKSRPPPQLLEASRSYVALRAQLHAELPQFLKLFEKGIFRVIGKFLEWQVEFFNAFRTRWAELWEALKVDGELQGEAEETLRVWWSRFADVEQSAKGLNILRVPPKDREPTRSRTRPRGSSVSDLIETGSTRSTVVISNLMAALDPLYPPPPSSASSQTLVPSPVSSKSQNLEKKMSAESVHSRKSGKSSRFSHKHSNSSASHTYRGDLFNPDDNTSAYTHSIHTISPPIVHKPSYHRTASMPISLPMPLRKSNSQGRPLDGPPIANSASSSTRSLSGCTPPQYDQPADELGRGRPSRKPSVKRRLTDGVKSAHSSSSRQRRSPSLPAMKNLNFPSPHVPAFAINQSRAVVAKFPVLYSCRAVHPCEPPPGVSYQDIPFFTVRVGEIFDILEEAGHPSTHRNLPLYVDEGEDCLLLVRNNRGDIGWVLASFLLPVD